MNKKIFTAIKLTKFGFIPTLMLLVFGTFAAFAETHSDYNKNFDFAKLKTWDFANSRVNTRDAEGKNPVWDDTLRSDISMKLQSGGFTQGSDNPDFLVRYHLGTKENLKTEVYRERFPEFAYYRRGFVFWRGGWGGTTEVFNTPYDVSTLVVDIVDAHTNQLVWRGYDTKTLDLNRSDKTLEKATANVLGKFEKDARRDEKRMG